MSHKQSKILRKLVKMTKAYQEALPTTTYTNTNVRNKIADNQKPYTTSTSVLSENCKRGVIRQYSKFQ